MVDRCVCCGEIVPEGRMVCWKCEHMTPEHIKINGVAANKEQVSENHKKIGDKV